MTDALTKEQIDDLLRFGSDEDLQLLARYLTEPLYHFVPRPDQKHLHDEQKSFVEDKFDGLAVACGGTASGKSIAGAYKVARFLLETKAPQHLTPYWIVSTDFDTTGRIWVQKLRQFIPQQYIGHIIYRNAAAEQPKTVILKGDTDDNNWIIEFKSAEQGREAFQAAGLGGFWIDEQVPLDIVHECWARCRDWRYPGSKIWTLTPLEPQPDLEDIFNNRERYPDWHFYRLNTRLNTALADTSFLDNTPDDLKATRTIGDFANLTGAIFKEFNSTLHIIPPITLDKKWNLYRSIDLGYEHPTFVLWAAHDPKADVWYIYKEWFASEMLIRDKVEAIKKAAYWSDTDKHCVATYCDTEDRQQREELHALGLFTQPAKKEPVTLSIEVVRRHMMLGKNGKPRLFIFNTCPDLIRQVRKYRWAKRPRSSLNPRPTPEKPIMEDDDGVAALRYLIYSTAREIKPWSKETEPNKRTPFNTRIAPYSYRPITGNSPRYRFSK